MSNRFIPSGRSWTLPELLEEYRIKAGYTVEQAANHLNMPVEVYSKFESGKSPIDIFSINIFIEAFNLPKVAKKIAYDPQKPAYSYQFSNFRIKAGLTQEAVANHLNITPQSYAAYEWGRREPSIDSLIKLAKLYNTSIDILVGNDVSSQELAALYTKRKTEYNPKRKEEEDAENEEFRREYKRRPMIETRLWGEPEDSGVTP